jgi:hypothetical protein
MASALPVARKAAAFTALDPKSIPRRLTAGRV